MMVTDQDHHTNCTRMPFACSGSACKQGLQRSGRDGVMASPPPRRRYGGGGGSWKVLELPFSTCWQPLRSRMTNLSTVPYTYETGLIARLLGAVLEAAHAYGVRLLRVKEHLCTAAIYSINSLCPHLGTVGVYTLSRNRSL